jgi:hypothetical protein
MKSVNAPQLHRSVGHALALAAVLCTAAAQAQSEPEAEPEEEAQPAPEPRPQPQPQVQAQRPQMTAQPLPYVYQPYMNWRPLEARKPRSNLSWEPLPFGIALDLRTTWPQDSGARRILGKSDPRSAGVSASYDVLRLTDKLTASVDLGWSMNSNSQTSPSSSQASGSSSDNEKLRTHLFSLGLSVRYHILRWLAPYARVSSGVGWDKLTVGGNSEEWQDRQTFMHGSVGGGVFFRTPGVLFWPGSSTLGVALMASIEGGYFFAPSSKLAITASSDAEIKNPIPTAAVPIGTMDRSAPYMRVTLGALF